MRMCLCSLVCSAGVLLVTAVMAAPLTKLNVNLTTLLENTEAYNHSVTKFHKEQEYVESAHELTQGPGRCGEKFFCAVGDILHTHSNYTKRKGAYLIVRNINNFIKQNHINCTMALMNVTKTTEQVKLPNFLMDIVECIRCRNLDLNSTSC